MIHAFRFAASLLVACTIGSIAAGQEAEAFVQHQGILLSAGSGQLAMVGTDGKQKKFEIGPTAIIRLDGKPAALEDLKKGFDVTVTTDAEGKVVAVSCMLKNKGVTAWQPGT